MRQMERLKKDERKKRVKEIKEQVVSFLEGQKGGKYTFERIAEAEEIGFKVDLITKNKKVAWISEDARILSTALTELMNERRIRSENNSSKEAKVYWIE